MQGNSYLVEIVTIVLNETGPIGLIVRNTHL